MPLISCEVILTLNWCIECYISFNVLEAQAITFAITNKNFMSQS